MRWFERFSLYLKILLPLVFLLVFNISPSAWAVVEANRQARSAQKSGDHKALAESLRQLYQYQPWRLNLLEQIGREALIAGDLEQGVTFLNQADRAGRLSADGLFILGDAYLQMNDLNSAETVWNQLLVQKTDAAEPRTRAYERLAGLQREKREYAAAVQTVQRWRAEEPENAQAAYTLGLLLTIEKPAEALPLLIEAAQMDPDFSASVQALRGGLALATNTENNAAYAWLLIGRALGNAGQWDLAQEAFTRSTQVAPNYAEAWAFLGEAHYQVGENGKPELDQAVAINPKSSLVQALMALYWRRQGQPDKALPILQTIAGQEPEEPTWQVEIGYTQVEIGDLMAAQEAFQKAVDMAPNNAIYWQYLAKFSITNNVDVHGLGLPAARRAVVLGPKDPAALDTMGLALLRLGDDISAERFLQQALDIDTAYAPVFLHLGQLYLQRQDTAQAYSYLKRAASLAGEDAVGKLARRLLQQYYGENG